MIVVDSGDLLYSAGYDLYSLSKRDQEVTALKADLFLQTYNLMGYDAFTPGEVDLSWGVAELKKMEKKAKFSILLANLQDLKTKKPVFQPYLIKEMRGIRVGLFGLLSNRFSGSLDPHDKVAFRLTDPMEAAKQVIAELKKKKCKTIIIVAHMDESEQRKLAETFREVYFVVSGHERGLKRQPVEVRNAQILTAGTRGEYLGQMEFFLKEKPDETRLLSHYQIVTLRDVYGDHPQTAKLVNQFRADSKPLYSAESKSPSPERDPGMQSRPYAYPISKYMGDASCLSCHQPQHDNWKKTGHAKAFQTLVRDKRESDHTCLPCHTTGFGEVSGFGDVLENVQCESCHGPRRGHPEDG
ncbi:MAG: multiheme c-type cytochrome, partial [Deltaproteobacteria bacterium]|nr:multiheme c-type cytochrome [Deltaproteobacteria bacterium]